MPNEEKNIQKLRKLLSLMEPDGLTEESFKQHFQNVLDFVKKLKVNNEEYRTDLETRYEDRVKAIEDRYSGDMGKINEEVSKFAKEEITKMLSEVQKKLEEVKDGRDGLDADEEMILEKATEEATKNATENIKPLIPKIEDIEKDLPKLGNRIRDGLELLEGEERLDISAIKGLKELLSDLESGIKMATSKISGGGGGRVTRSYDLSPYLDGSTKIFTLPSMWRIITIVNTSTPTIFRPTVDYTYDAGTNTLTFTSEIEASASLAGGQTIMITYESTT